MLRGGSLCQVTFITHWKICQCQYYSLSLPIPFLFPYPFDRLWLTDEMKVWLRDIDFEVSRRVQERLRLIVPSHCVEDFFIPPISQPEAFLSPSMVAIDICKGFCWRLVPNPLMLAYLRDLVFNRGAAARLGTCISQV